MPIESASRRIIKKSIPTGKISYGLYILHFHLLYAMGGIVVFSGTVATFSVRVIALLVFAVVGAWLLEAKFQPLIKKILNSALKSA